MSLRMNRWLVLPISGLVLLMLGAPAGAAPQ